MKNLSFYILISIITIPSCYCQKYRLSDFYGTDTALSNKTEGILKKMSDKEIAGQMLIQAVGKLGKKTETVLKLVRQHKLGGVILLSGEKKTFQRLVKKIDSVAIKHKSLPILYSADAEPSLINRKIKGTKKVPVTSSLKSEKQIQKVAAIISKDLKDMRIKLNFAPICDISINNKAIGNRSFGSNKDSIILLSNAFIQASQETGIAATAKHFPGHGFVQGDTHKELVYIDGELREIDIYPPLIRNGVIGIMVAHIAVKNNPKFSTNGLPASLSEVIIKKLLQSQLGFKGIVISDAMNMKAASDIPQATLKAAKAGCDMILMPTNENETIASLVDEMRKDELFREQVRNSVRKIIRLKVCLGLI